MTIVLDKLRWKPMWVTHLGAVKGGLDHLGISTSDAWLTGATGHAFVMNIDAAVSAAGPTAWSTERMVSLGHNLGYTTQGVWGWRSEQDFAAKQKIAWEQTKRALLDGYPCYGFELGIPEYYVVNGCDERGYLYSGIGTAEPIFALDKRHRAALDSGMVTEGVRLAFAQNGISLDDRAQMNRRFGCFVVKDISNDANYSILETADGSLLVHTDYDAIRGHKPWEELGAVAGSGFLEMYWLEPCDRSDDRETLKEALDFALMFAKSPPQWVFGGNKAGLEAYDVWLRALDAGTADGFGAAYNAAVWSECRLFAASFLHEARERIGGAYAALLSDAEEHYAAAHRGLAAAAEALPFHLRQPSHIGEPERVHAALNGLRAARKAEAAGLATLEQLVRQLA